MFCVNCGKELEDGANVCANCGNEVGKSEKNNSNSDVEVKKVKEKKKLNISPLTFVTMILTGISFLCGFIFVTISFARPFFIQFIETMVLIPTLASIAISAYKFWQTKGNKEDKTTWIISLICMCVSAFVLFYSYIGYLALLG